MTMPGLLNFITGWGSGVNQSQWGPKAPNFSPAWVRILVDPGSKLTSGAI